MKLCQVKNRKLRKEDDHKNTDTNEVVVDVPTEKNENKVTEDDPKNISDSDTNGVVVDVLTRENKTKGKYDDPRNICIC